MNITTGTDIIEVKRIQELIEKYGETFLSKVYTKEEIDYCEKKKNSKYQHYAARFAAKEAVYKAISKNSNKPIEWKDIEVAKDANGRPKIKEEKLSGYSIDVSLSHIQEFAIANVVAIAKEGKEEC